jgi:hypothetical protein
MRLGETVGKNIESHSQDCPGRDKRLERLNSEMNCIIMC